MLIFDISFNGTRKTFSLIFDINFVDKSAPTKKVILIEPEKLFLMKLKEIEKFMLRKIMLGKNYAINKKPIMQTVPKFL